MRRLRDSRIGLRYQNQSAESGGRQSPEQNCLKANPAALARGLQQAHSVANQAIRCNRPRSGGILQERLQHRESCGGPRRWWSPREQTYGQRERQEVWVEVAHRP